MDSQLLRFASRHGGSEQAELLAVFKDKVLFHFRIIPLHAGIQKDMIPQLFAEHNLDADI